MMMNDGNTITFPSPSSFVHSFIHSSFPRSSTFLYFYFFFFFSSYPFIRPFLLLFFLFRSYNFSFLPLLSASSAKKSKELTNEEARILRVMMTVWSKAEKKGYLTSVRESEKKEGQTSKAANRKNIGENAGLFLLLLHFLSLSLVSLVFWIFGKIVREEEKKKKKKETKEQRREKKKNSWEKNKENKNDQILSPKFQHSD